ncbi:hypothetical protein [uncultured Paraglaciecola sp.]|uniref:hypothetical protein n=1 Tax=uncultured Paraglaciecola sp. TaxID=1765024 RepID=UPI00262E0999|nr:hypothetical protein [uncultured Paraglaciecola sp.]
MLTVKKFKEKLGRSKHPDYLQVAFDADNTNQFYIVGNGGMGTTVSAPVESFLPEIKEYVIATINSGGLVKNEEASLLLDRNLLVHYLSLADA